MISERNNKIFITDYNDVLKMKWKVSECSTKGCWCAIIDIDPVVYWEHDNSDDYDEEVYIAGSGSIPREVAEHIVNLHNKSIIDEIEDWPVQNLTFESQDQIGDLFSLHEFDRAVKNNLFIDYDGHGYLATYKQQSNIIIKPSMLGRYKMPLWVTHIMWYNR